MEQKAVAEVESICFSMALPGKKKTKNWNMKLALNWQLSEIYIYFFKWISEFTEKENM